MSSPKWMSYKSVVLIHDNEIARNGGLVGIRDNGLLISAVESPKMYYHYCDPKPDIPELAAIYAYGIAMNHAFFDANKRTSMVVSLAFLDVNGFDLSTDQIHNYATFRSLGAGEISKEQLIAWFKQYTIPLK